MGDMADMILGDLELEAAYYSHPYTPESITCDRCGEQELTWTMDKGKWRLYGLNGWHICRIDATDDFEDLGD